MSNGTMPSTPKVALDKNMKDTLQWTAIFYIAGRAAEFIIGWIGTRFFAGGLVGRIAAAFGGYGAAFPVSALIRELIWAAIIGLVLGFLFSKFWPWWQNFNRKTFKFTSVFKFFFVWDIIAAVVVGLLLSFTVFAIGALPLLFNIAGIVVGAFIFAKGFQTKLGHLYKL